MEIETEFFFVSLTLVSELKFFSRYDRQTINDFVLSNVIVDAYSLTCIFMKKTKGENNGRSGIQAESYTNTSELMFE